MRKLIQKQMQPLTLGFRVYGWLNEYILLDISLLGCIMMRLYVIKHQLLNILFSISIFYLASVTGLT